MSMYVYVHICVSVYPHVCMYVCMYDDMKDIDIVLGSSLCQAFISKCPNACLIRSN